MMHPNTPEPQRKPIKGGRETSDSRNAQSAGPADVGANIDPSSLSAGINQTSAMKGPRTDNPTEQDEDIKTSSATSFNAPEEGLDSADSIRRDSRAPEDFNTNEPKSYGSEGQVNESRSPARQAGSSGRSEESEKSTGNSSRSQAFEKSARNSQGTSTARAGDSQINSARQARSSQGSSEESSIEE